MANTENFTRLNQGFNVKTFLIAVIFAGAVIGVCLYLFVASRGTKDIPKASQPHPNAAVVMPGSSRSA